MEKKKLHTILFLLITILSIAIAFLAFLTAKKLKNKNTKANDVEIQNIISNNKISNCNFTLSKEPNYIILHSLDCRQLIIINPSTLQQKQIQY